MIFENREQAGKLLAEELFKLKLDSHQTIIAAIPRGGVVVGKVISEYLGIDLAVIVIKKLGAPGNSELAIGATATHGAPILDNWLIRDLKISPQYLKGEIRQKRKEAVAREKFLGVVSLASQVQDKNVIVVDDGMATGQTARAAAKVLRDFGVKGLILVVPCASSSVLELVSGSYDQVICLERREDFWAVGQFYRDFRPVEESEVKELLATSN